MISYLKGKIIKKGENYIILDVSNVGYRIFVNENFASKLKKDSEAEIYTHQYVREDSLNLYGFSCMEELEMFELLLSISGIGPKSALSAMSIASVADLKGTIAREDPTLLTKVSGIGKKTAERVVLELKDKISSLSSGPLGEADSRMIGSDEIDALMTLGYSLAQAREALSKIDKGIDDKGERVKQALKLIRK